MKIMFWTCHICGDERPDEIIMVRKIDSSAKYDLPAGTVEENVRYCADRLQCVQGSKVFSFSNARSKHEAR